jgi:hypothetical protein
VGISIGDTTVMLGNGQEIESDVPAQIINGRTMVPLRILSEGIGATVDWDASTRTVTVTTPEITGESPTEVKLESKSDTVEGSVSKVTYSYPVVTDVYTAADLLNKNIAADAKAVATEIANNNVTGKTELSINYEISTNSSGILSILYLIDGESVSANHYGITNGAVMSDEGYGNEMYGGQPKSNDDRYTIEDYNLGENGADGGACIVAEVYYPQFTSDEPAISSLNTMIENSAKKAADSFIASYKDEAIELYDSLDADKKTLSYEYFEDFELEITEDNIATYKSSFKEDFYNKDTRTGDDTIKINLTTGEVIE